MQAAEIMTTQVVAVAPDTPLREIARLLLEHGISAVPVVDAGGAPIGMVSEGDLISRNDAEREARRDWWLALMAEGEELHPDFLATLRQPQQTARDVMAAPVVTVSESTEARVIAGLLSAHHVKRVPVVHDGRLVGIVSRADLLRAFAAEPAPAAPEQRSRASSLIAAALASLDEHFLPSKHSTSAEGVAADDAPAAGGVTAADFLGLVTEFEHLKAERSDQGRHAAAERRRQALTALIDRHVVDESWKALLHSARQAAERGEKETMLLRFPSDLCADGGRAINAPLPEWPKTLRGDAAEIYLRWERDLKPQGFHLAARVLDFPGGMPGDIGLFLVWG